MPTTKEQTAARAAKERNRESAAASRQKQRDRISELEDEVGAWRDRFSEAIDRLRALEGRGEFQEGRGMTTEGGAMARAAHPAAASHPQESGRSSTETED